MLGLIKDNKIDETNYNYLLPLKQYLTSPENSKILQDQNSLVEFFKKYVTSGYKALFIIK